MAYRATLTIRNAAELIKQTVTMREVCEHYGFRVNTRSKSLCPFHNDRNASMHVYPRDRGFYCFSCGAHGSVIDFVMMLFGLTFPAAVERLNADLGLGYVLDDNNLTKTDKRAMAEAKRIREEREEKQRQIDLLQAEYDRWLTAYTKYDKIIRDKRPRHSSEVTDIDSLDPEFMDALMNIDEAGYNMSEALLRLSMAEKEL